MTEFTPDRFGCFSCILLWVAVGNGLLLDKSQTFYLSRIFGRTDHSLFMALNFRCLVFTATVT